MCHYLNRAGGGDFMRYSGSSRQDQFSVLLLLSPPRAIFQRFDPPRESSQFPDEVGNFVGCSISLLTCCLGIVECLRHAFFESCILINQLVDLSPTRSSWRGNE